MFLKNELQSRTVYKLKYGKIYTFDDMIEIKRRPPITEAITKRALKPSFIPNFIQSKIPFFIIKNLFLKIRNKN